MKKNNGLFFANILISGFIAILYLTYNTIVSDAALIASFMNDIFVVNETPIEIAKWVYADAIFCIVGYTIYNVINYVVYKKNNKILLIVLNFLVDIILVTMIIFNIRLFL